MHETGAKPRRELINCVCSGNRCPLYPPESVQIADISVGPLWARSGPQSSSVLICSVTINFTEPGSHFLRKFVKRHSEKSIRDREQDSTAIDMVQVKERGCE